MYAVNCLSHQPILIGRCSITTGSQTYTLAEFNSNGPQNSGNFFDMSLNFFDMSLNFFDMSLNFFDMSLKTEMQICQIALEI